ncbi:MAG TPA: WD40 repeat domain-containing protein [Bacteroidia bacterium]|nr:WD40 repeat domain-containing protein [Bacteroidia bacterium]
MALKSTKLKNPFVGLRSFEEEEDYLFFGRSAEINDLLKKFASSPFLAVVGSSGSGKSSLVKSGFLPSIYSGFLSAGRNWRVALMRPGDNPIGNLAQSLAVDSVLYDTNNNPDIPRSSIIEAVLRRSGNGLINVYDRANLTETDNLLIIVDQFEELFRFSRYEKRIHEERSDALNFVNLLLTASAQRVAPIYVLITMRSDFLGDCSQFRGLPEAINNGQYLVPRMTRDEIREAITGPIKVGGAEITPRLLTKLLNDLGTNTDQLPILQHALMRTWDEWIKRNEPQSPIDIEDYEKIGSLAEALSLHADEAYKELDTDEKRKICELMFKALCDTNADVRGIRRPQLVSELADITQAPMPKVIEVVDVFRKEGRTFLMPPATVTNLTNNSIIDISHESIMRKWQRLIQWNAEEAKSGEIFVRLADEAKLYDAKEVSLYKDGEPELAIATKWYKDNKPNAAWALRYNTNYESAIGFLEKSEQNAKEERKEKERIARNKKRFAFGVIVFFALLALAAGFVSYYMFGLKNEAETAKSKSDSTATYADSVRIVSDTNAEKAIRAESAALDSAEAAKIARNDAMIQKAYAEQLTLKAQLLNKQLETEQATLKKAYEDLEKQSRKIAASAYKDSIREGPTIESEIKKVNFDLTLVAYIYHLVDSLGVEAKSSELYPKVFACLSANSNKDSVLSKQKEVQNFTDSISLGNDTKISLSKDKLKVMLNLKGYNVDSINVSKNPVECFAADNVDSLIFCGTDSNTIKIYKYNEKFKLTKEVTVPLNGLVTAIDYNAVNDVIYFGLRTGEIGYIQYKNKKYDNLKTVYENELGSKVTAIDFFEHNKKFYLLATSLKGKVIVYDFGPADPVSALTYLVPDKKLTGIELPENLREIQHARFDELSGKVKLASAKGNYDWNPFTDEALKMLENWINKDIDRQKELERITKDKKTKWY